MHRIIASSSKNQCQRKPCAQISFASSAENDEELLRRYRICINAGGGGSSAGTINNPASTVSCQYDVKGNMCVITSNSFGSFFNKKKKPTTSASSFVSVGTTTRTSKTKITQRRTKRQKVRTSTRQLLKTKSAGGATTSNVKQAAEEDIQLAESDLDSMDLSALKSTGVKAFKPFSESTLNMQRARKVVACSY